VLVGARSGGRHRCAAGCARASVSPYRSDPIVVKPWGPGPGQGVARPVSAHDWCFRRPSARATLTILFCVDRGPPGAAFSGCDILRRAPSALDALEKSPRSTGAISLAGPRHTAPPGVVIRRHRRGDHPPRPARFRCRRSALRADRAGDCRHNPPGHPASTSCCSIPAMPRPIASSPMRCMAGRQHHRCGRPCSAATPPTRLRRQVRAMPSFRCRRVFCGPQEVFFARRRSLVSPNVSTDRSRRPPLRPAAVRVSGCDHFPSFALRLRGGPGAQHRSGARGTTR